MLESRKTLSPSIDSLSTTLKTSPKPVGYRISDVAEETGITESVLRIWEARYGWPTPARKSSGYRHYSAEQLEALKIVKYFLDAGRPIGEIIRDPQLDLFSGKVPVLNSPPRKPVKNYNFAAIPFPRSPDAAAVRMQLEAAITADDKAVIQRLEMECVRLRPADRECAVHALLRLRSE